MSERKRKIFSADFKAKVALGAIHGVKTLNEIAQRNTMVHPVQVSNWKKELQQQAASLFDHFRSYFKIFSTLPGLRNPYSCE